VNFSVLNVSGRERPALKRAYLILTFLCPLQVSYYECGFPTLWVRILIIKDHGIKSTMNTRLIKRLIQAIDDMEQTNVRSADQNIPVLVEAARMPLSVHTYLSAADLYPVHSLISCIFKALLSS